MKLDPIATLQLQLARLPGIGPRSAARLAFYIIKTSQAQGKNANLAEDLAQSLLDVQKEVRLCRECQNLCTEEYCSICRDPRRDQSMLCVVEAVPDMQALEKSGTFRGLYHVLHGVLAPLEGVGPEELKLEYLLARAKNKSVEEVIIATNANVDGDATALYLASLLEPQELRITRLAMGVPLGSELEYLDSATLSRALLERKEMVKT
jgi:recombination protein RecR